MSATVSVATCHDWSLAEVRALFGQPLNDLLFQAQTVHHAHLDPNRVQISTLLSIRAGTYPEDCKYCPQSDHYNTGLDKEELIEAWKVLEAAAEAKTIGPTHFCMDTAWKHPSAKNMPYILEMVKGVKKFGLETYMTLGRLTQEQTQALADAGPDYYSHNLDTSPESCGNTITTRTYSGRLRTLAYVHEAGMEICSDGILGVGGSVDSHTGLLIQLANLPKHPGPVPINMLVEARGALLAEERDVDPLDFIHTLAVARIMIPKSHVRLPAGRKQIDERVQALTFMAGANSIFYDEKLLATKNPQAEKDIQLFTHFGIKPEEHGEHADEMHQAAVKQVLVEQRDSQLFYDATST